MHSDTIITEDRRRRFNNITSSNNPRQQRRNNNTGTSSANTRDDNCDWTTRFCGCCCDMRMSVIIVNIVSVYLAVLAIALDIAGLHVYDDPSSPMYNDDENDTVGDDDIMSPSSSSSPMYTAQVKFYDNIVPITLSVNSFFVIVHGLGIYGGTTKKIWPVALSVVGYGINIGLGLFLHDLIQIGIAALFMYPHCFLIGELKRGNTTHRHNNSTTTGATYNNHHHDRTHDTNIDDNDDDDETVQCDDLSQAASVADDYDDDDDKNDGENGGGNRDITNVERQTALGDTIPRQNA